MEPAFYRGDLLFLTNPADQRYQTGDITVYKIPGADIPIVHRVLETHDLVAESKGCVRFLPLALHDSRSNDSVPYYSVAYYTYALPPWGCIWLTFAPTGSLRQVRSGRGSCCSRRATTTT